ncbi:MAG: hypothetical protein V4488_05890 [Pseudomonadota bacterium]
MTDMKLGAEQAARLVYKALHTSLVPANDSEYRELMAHYRADTQFAFEVQKVAVGFELTILDASERGLIVVPASRNSRFAIRMTDIRVNLEAAQKACLLLAHVAIAASFYPTTDGLDDDNYIAPPIMVSSFRDNLHALARRLKESSNLPSDIPVELAPGWEAVCAMPLVLPGGQRSSPNSIVGIIKITLTNMLHHGLVRGDRKADDENSAAYTPTHRLRIQLRELALRRLFDIAQDVVQPKTPSEA